MLIYGRPCSFRMKYVNLRILKYTADRIDFIFIGRTSPGNPLIIYPDVISTVF